MARFPIGSVVSGSLRPEDLIPAFMDTLQELADDLSLSLPVGATFEQTESVKREYDRIQNLLAAIERRQESDDYYGSEDAACDLDELQTELEAFAPSCCYFGAHPGDGADFGFWVSEYALEEFDGLRVDDLSEVPEDYTGEVLHVNDHGNATLYACDNGHLSEVWSIV